MSLELLLPLFALLGALVGWCVLKIKKRQDGGKPVSTRQSSFARFKRKNLPPQAAQPEKNLSSALILELSAAMLRAGQSLGGVTYQLSQLTSAEESDTLFEVSRGLSHGLGWQAAWQRAETLLESSTPPSIIPLRDCLESLADQGAPTADLLDIVAERHRRVEQRRAEKAAAKLSVKLVVPLGLCSLPAFICWGVIPVMFALLPGLTNNL